MQSWNSKNNTGKKGMRYERRRKCAVSSCKAKKTVRNNPKGQSKNEQVKFSSKIARNHRTERNGC